MPSNSYDHRYQILVIGSGLPGAILALVLARLGFNVCVVDRVRHPRFAIGESSTPTTDAYVSRIADDFDIPELKPLARYATTRETYPELTVGKKRGFSYFWHEQGMPFATTPNHQNEMLVAASPSDELADSQWLRSDIDTKVVSWFEKYGIQFFDSTTIQEIKRVKDGWELNVVKGDSNITLSTDFFVDAAGGNGTGIRAAGGQSKLEQMWTNTSAVFAHFSGVKHWGDCVPGNAKKDFPFACDDSAVHHLLRQGWLWQLRFDSDLTSCGLVQSNQRSSENLNGLNNSSAALHYLVNTIAQYPSLAEQMRSSQVVTPVNGAFYRSRIQHWYKLSPVDRCCALPNSIGFVDPLHSKGLAHALSGVYRLGTAFRDAGISLPSELDSKLEELMRQFDREIEFLDRLIFICYASIDRFDNFRLAAFWYFAAATNFEHSCLVENSLNRPFLFSDNSSFRKSLFQYASQLRNDHQASQLRNDHTSSLARQEELDQMARELLGPFDRVGLFRPSIPNMYSHTAAPKGVK